MAGLTLAMTGLAQLPTATAADRSTAQVGDPQSGEASDFSGYVGYLGEDGAAGAALPDESITKPHDPTLADPDDVHGVDVPGAEPVVVPPLAAWQPPTAPDPAAVARLRARLAADGEARVIVMTDATQRPEAKLSQQAVSAQRASIADSLDGLRASLRGTGSRQVARFGSVPSAVWNVTPAGLDALLADPSVVSVVADGLVHGDLATSTGVIDSDRLNAAGVRGNGYDGGPGQFQVAVIDSGVDNGHNAFSGKIVAQACFVTDNSCPGGTDSATGPGTAEECTHSTDCDHGTHVGSIAAGLPFSGGHEGVAPGAGIVAVKVAQDNPNSSRWTAQFSAIDNGLQHVLDLRNGAFPRIASVNLSIGTNATFTAGNPACNNTDPTTVSLFQQLQAAGVAVVVAAGNNGSNNSMSFPGCASNAFAIGATNDADVPAGFTNSSAGLRWWAPGVSIDAAVPTGNNHGFKDGTSMAAPHVAGSFALLRECVDGNGVGLTNAAAAGRLDATGVNVTRNGVTRKRVNVLDAATGTVNNNDFASPEVIPGNPGASGFNDFDFTVCSDTEPGEPGPFSLDNGIWWSWTPSATGTATISTEDGGGFATTFDTTLAVYTGNSLGTLTNIAADDDSGTGLRSLVTLPVNGGTTYRIKVDGFAAANGLLNLHVQNGPPPTCFGAAATRVGTNLSETINGTAGNDVIVAGAGNDTINGGGGNDTICTDAGDDVVNGGSGNDTVAGGSGADTINGQGGNDVMLGNPGGGSNDDTGDLINGGAGDDWLDGWFGNDVLDGGAGDDTIRGEAGIDRALYVSSPGSVTADLSGNSAAGAAGNDTFVLVENLTGSAFNDHLTGDGLPNSLLGGGGNDVLRGRGDNDVLVGAAGVDVAAFDVAPAGVTVNLTTGTSAGGEGNDAIAGIENVWGSGFADTIVGNGFTNVLRGLGGNDTLRGAGARDVLAGGAGNDQVRGEAGQDRLFGEAGNDALNGGSQADACNGGPGLDSGLSCESTTGIP